ncbi:Ribonuclease H domain [Macleaya cordata]|uniref:Ribonuclease H domain n=1 Tax=Macleaya cordata TaxID=56857 RepID=A0A200Q390_MACCD|nr:Ribonuclease H domain [Macleaya cordata]
MMHSKTPTSLVQSIEFITGFHRKTSVMTYLGAPICDGRIKVLYFDEMLTKIRKKLAGGKTYHGPSRPLQYGHLSDAAVSVPITVLQNINRLIAKFFWGSHDGKPKRNWVSWKAICRPVWEGGMGIRNIDAVVTSFRLKGLWNGVVNNSIWASFIRGKYSIDIINLAGYVPPRTASKFWKECTKLISVLVENSAWEVGHGNINFWLENWSNAGILAEMLPGTLHSTSISLREVIEVDFNIPGLTDASTLHMHNLYESRLSAGSDKRLWAWTSNGIFSVKSAFEKIREVSPLCPFARFYWANFVPKKLSVFFWRAINKAIPVDVRIQNCAISLASGCVCCVPRSIESFDHLFLHVNIAAPLWDYFAPPFGIHREDYLDFWDFIWAWFNVSPGGSQMGSLATFIPLAIMWETWWERNHRIHNDHPSGIISIRYKVLNWIQDINPSLKVSRQSPSSIRNVLHTCRITLTSVRRKPIKILRWSQPPPGYFILNTDGSASYSSAAGGGVVRDYHGKIVTAFHRFYGSGTSNLAESRALLDGLGLCMQLEIRRIAVRVDSSLVASWFHYKYDVPWALRRWWHKIRELAQGLDLVVGHVYRELNAPADFMAAMGLSSRSDCNFMSNFPSPLVGLARLDRMGIPYIRLG